MPVGGYSSRLMFCVTSDRKSGFWLLGVVVNYVLVFFFSDKKPNIPAKNLSSRH